MIYFVTVNYYSTELIETLLQSIAATGEYNYQVLIVNNSPEDDSVNALAEPSRVTVITAERNLGFGAGCNLGIQQVYSFNPSAVIWLINPDAQLQPDAIVYVRQCLAHSSIAILGTRIRDLSGKLWFSLGTYNPWSGSLKCLSEHLEPSDAVGTLESRWVSGCSLILNLSAFDHCPHFDPQYFLYYEDADLCERYYRQGYQIRLTQAVLVTHNVSAIAHKNAQAKFQHATFSKLYFLNQHGTPFALGLNLIYLLMRAALFLPFSPAVAIGSWQGLQAFMRWWVRQSFQPGVVTRDSLASGTAVKEVE